MGVLDIFAAIGRWLPSTPKPKRKVSLSTSELDKILDPVQFLERRRHLGAPSPKEVERMIKERRERVRRERRLVKEREERIAYSLSRLEKLVRETK